MRNRPALAISVVALFVALGGTGYAAFSLPRNSVGAKQLKRNAVTTPKIKNGAVTTGKLKNGAVTGSKMNFRGVIVPQAAAASSALSAANATHAVSADGSTSATNATNAGHASMADAASNAGHASTADNASHATASDTAAAATSPATLGSGQTEVGFVYQIVPNNSASTFMGQQISFPHPLASTPNTEFVQIAGPPTTHCPGSTTNPRAISGYLCVYMITSSAGLPNFDQTTRFGTGVSFPTGVGGSPPTGDSFFVGVWAATG